MVAWCETTEERTPIDLDGLEGGEQWEAWSMGEVLSGL